MLIGQDLHATGGPDLVFAVLSDVHTGGGYGAAEDLARAVSMLKARGVTDVSVCGDVTDSGTSAQLSAFKAATAGLTVDACRGNHDYGISPGAWSGALAGTYDSRSNMVKVAGGCAFVYLSLDNTTMTASATLPYPSASIAWLSGVLKEHAGRRTFVFLHYPLYTGSTVAGLVGAQRYGFTATVQPSAILEELRAHGSAVAFNGHTHYAFEVESDVPGVTFSPAQPAFHVPSLAYPRNASHVVINPSDPSRQPAQGYVVSVYPDRVVVQGVDLSATASDQVKGDDIRGHRYELEI